MLLFWTTRAHPLICFEDAHDELQQASCIISIWQAELVAHKRQTLKRTREVTNLIKPHSQDLPSLFPWAMPNGCGIIGVGQNAYMDAPSCHPEVEMDSGNCPHAPRVMVAVLVNCPHEPQYLPDMNAAHSVADVLGLALGHGLPPVP